jgi:hypothetical protein
MNNIKKNDLIFGNLQEKEVLKILKLNFDDTLKKTSNNYFVFDFESENCYIELKSRRINHNKFNDTMIGINKLKFAETCSKSVFFVFSFTDGLYYWKYNKEDINNNNITFREGGRIDRGRDELKNYAFIKIKILKKLYDNIDDIYDEYLIPKQL